MRLFSWARIESERTRSLLKGLLFISPWLIGLLVFTVFPIIASLYYSFMQYDILRPPRFIGLQNYTRMLTEDMTFRLVLGNTLYFVVIGVPAGILVAFLLASLLNNDMRARPVFRTIFFLPTLVPAVASAEVWRWVYNSRWGLINSALKSMGLSIIPFLSSPEWAKPSLILIECWAQGSAMVIFLAALQDVPASLYDAATVDGANVLQRFWHVTVPMCTPAILFVMLTSIIGTFQYFALGWLLTEGGPNRATEFYSLYLYRIGFREFKMGYASALAWVLFLIIVVSTIAMFKLSGRWVFYRGESR